MIRINSEKNDRGFSLVELIVLLAMTAILAAMAIPMLSSTMRSVQLASDARSIATTMTYAKLGAVSQMTHYRLVVDLDENEWRMEKQNRSTNGFELQQAVNQLSSGIARSGITFKRNSSTAPPGFPTATSTIIQFNSRGIVTDPSDPTVQQGIIYISDRNEDYAVSASLSGKVQIWRYRNSRWTPQ